MKFMISMSISLILNQASFAAEHKHSTETKRKPASSGNFFCTITSSGELQTRMEAECDTKLPFSIAAQTNNNSGVTHFTYCCTAK